VQEGNGSLSLVTALLTLLCALTLQISSNLINDYYDGVKGLDGVDRLGPERVTSLGLLAAPVIKKGFIASLFLAFLFGLYLMIHAGLPIIIIGLLSLFFAWAYTGGPFPLSYYALGEAFAFLFFGPVAVWGSYFIQTQNLALPSIVLLGGSSVGLLSSAIMGVNNLRDIDQDRLKAKVTLATLLGAKAMRLLIMTFIILSTALATAMLWPLPLAAKACPVIIFCLFWPVWRQVLYRAQARELNNTLANIGKFLFISTVINCVLLTFLETQNGIAIVFNSFAHLGG